MPAPAHIQESWSSVGTNAVDKPTAAARPTLKPITPPRAIQSLERPKPTPAGDAPRPNAEPISEPQTTPLLAKALMLGDGRWNSPTSSPATPPAVEPIAIERASPWKPQG